MLSVEKSWRNQMRPTISAMQKVKHASANECCDKRPVKHLGKRRPGRESKEQSGQRKKINEPVQGHRRFRAQYAEASCKVARKNDPEDGDDHVDQGVHGASHGQS